jgi:cytochrome oxidase Cu insertion factor (SCO1/SenC/PrrC family)
MIPSAMIPSAILALTAKPVRSIAIAGLLLGLATAASGCGRGTSSPAEDADCCAATSSPANDTALAGDLALDRIALPSSRLVDQDGRQVDLAGDLVGNRVAAIQFIFTRCATTCPILANQFERVRERLGDEMGQEFALISITVDPEFDRPETLKSWGRQHGIGPGWSLLTGPKADIDRCLRALGMPTADPQNHQSQVVVIDGTTGQGLRTSGLASSAELVAILRRVRNTRVAVQPDTRNASAGAAPAVSSRAADEAAERWFTNATLVDQSGRRLQFYRDVLRDRTVVIDVFFSECKGSCVVMGNTLARLQERLGDRLEGEVRLISITVDSPRDDAATLAAYARKYGARKGWYFLGGDKADVDSVLKKLGQHVEAREAHGTVMLVGNMRTGLWKKVFGLADAEQVIDQVQAVIDDKGVQ